ncbi:hypothetical protein [Pontibacter chitinilyticus]|uniref:hypothetical protein n=1 Tax=Pontibacter chitinilyticus TaxID=2674989 RepID=UPI00321BD088
MLLFDNSAIKLSYDPSTDILEADYPDLHGSRLSEVIFNLDKLVEAVSSYDIKLVLLNSSTTAVSVGDAESRQVAAHLAAGLARTRVLRVARVSSQDQSVEETAQANMGHIRRSLRLPFELKSFPSREEAVRWLRGEA